MGRKNILEPHLVLDAVSMATSFTSEETNIKNQDELGYEVSWTGTSPVGEIKVEVKVKNIWEALPITTMPVAANSGSYTILIDKQSQFTAVRLSYVRTSGVGSMSAYINACVVGA